jgi:arylformamidase
MSDPDIDAAYSARRTATDAEFDAEMARYRAESERAVQGLDGHRAIRFDTESDERLDIWGVERGAVRPAVVAVHGGYWRMLSRFDTSFMAATLAGAGIATVPVDYTLAPAATLEEIVRQVRTAIAWLHRHGREYGVDPERLHVVGSSAGGHLAAMTLVGGWHAGFGLPPDAIKGGLLVSGLFDLRPLVASFANEWLGLDAERAAALSPYLAPAGTAPLVVADAEREAAGFHTQSDRFHARWRTDAPCRRLTVPARNHFDVFTDLADPRSALARSLVELVR